MSTEFLVHGQKYRANLNWDAPEAGTIPGKLWLTRRAKAKKAKGVVIVNNVFAGFCEEVGGHSLLAAATRHLGSMANDGGDQRNRSSLIVIKNDPIHDNAGEAEPKFSIITILKGGILPGQTSDMVCLGASQCLDMVKNLLLEGDFQHVHIDDRADEFKLALKAASQDAQSHIDYVDLSEMAPESTDGIKDPNSGTNLRKAVTFGGITAVAILFVYVLFGSSISRMIFDPEPITRIEKTVVQHVDAIPVSDFLFACKRAKNANRMVPVGWRLKSVGCYREITDKRLGGIPIAGKPGFIAEYTLSSENPGLVRDLARLTLSKAIENTTSSYVILDSTILMIVPLDAFSMEVTEFPTLATWRVDLDRNLVGIAENYNLALQAKTVNFKSSYPIEVIAERLKSVPGTEILQAVFIDQAWTVDARMMAPAIRNDLKSRLSS